MQQIEYTFSHLLIKLMHEIDLDYNIFYTEDYVEIIKDRKKYDDTICSDTDGEILKMLIYALKNKNIKFDNEYFQIILEIMKIYSANEKVNNYAYNILIAFLSLSYDNNTFLKYQEDDIFLEQINSLGQIVIPLLIDIYGTSKKTHPLFEKLKKYSPIIMGIILENDEIIRNVFYRSNTIVSNKINMLERSCFMMVVAAFLENIKELNYNYNIITDIMIGIKIYLFQNIDKFELGTEECLEQTSIIEDKINSVIESAIEIKQYRRKLN